MIRFFAAPALGAVALFAAPGLPAAVEPDFQLAIETSPPGPVALLGGPLPAPPFVLRADGVARIRATQCLAEAVYYEAGFESEIGKRAVAQVVVNRVRDRNFPATVCGVVYQGSGGGACQFSFACDGSLDRRPPHDAEWTAAWQVAEQALTGHVVDELGAATHYHARYVTPDWSRTLVEVGGIGLHRFYRWPGRRGLAGALEDRYRGSEPMPKI